MQKIKKTAILTLILLLSGMISASCAKKKSDDSMLLLGISYLLAPKHSAYIEKQSNNFYLAILQGYIDTASSSDEEYLQDAIDSATAVKTVIDSVPECSKASAGAQTVIDDLSSGKTKMIYLNDYTKILIVTIESAPLEGATTLRKLGLSDDQITNTVMLTQKEQASADAYLGSENFILTGGGTLNDVASCQDGIEAAYPALTDYFSTNDAISKGTVSKLKVDPVFYYIPCVYGSAATTILNGKCATLADEF